MILDALIRRTGATVTVPMYPLAPEHTVDDAIDFLDAVTARLTAEDIQKTVLMGDSAGGGLALAYAMQQRDRAATPTASALALFAPWVDVTMTNPDIAAIEPRDVLNNSRQLTLCGKWWAGQHATTDSKVSPLYGDLRGLPPIHLYVGDRDLLMPDINLLHRRIRESGGFSELILAAGGFHVYLGAPWTPEGRCALDHTAAIVRDIRNT